MRLYEALNSLQSEEEPYFGYGWYGNEFLQEFGIEDYSYSNFPGLSKIGFTCRPIKTWMCSDTLVGYYAIYHDKELICVSHQPARKEGMEFQWVSEEVFNRIFIFLRSHISYDDNSKTILDPNQEIN